MNRRQLLVVGLVVGLLLIGWMLGRREYELHGPLTLSWEIDPSQVGEPHPSAQPASSTVAATVSCAGPLASPDEQLDVRSPGLAAVGFAPWQPVFGPNPCPAEQIDRRRTLALEALAVLLLGLVGLITLRTRSHPRDSGPGRRPLNPAIRG